MENSIRKMLVAIDGSETAAKALDYALNLAEKCGSEVHIVSVVSPIESIIPRFTLAPLPSTLYTSFIDEIEKKLKTVLSEALEDAKKKNPKLKIFTRLLRGHPADKIVQTAKEESFDIIVIGNRGQSGIDELFLGSVSNRVADYATCPVLIVKLAS